MHAITLGRENITETHANKGLVRPAKHGDYLANASDGKDE